MNGDPFGDIVQKIRGDSRGLIPASYRIGTVTKTAPLEVEVAGVSQEAEDLLKNDLLAAFNVGDQLLLMPIDDEQRYIILCKVVDA